jgi:hypothetical protein
MTSPVTTEAPSGARPDIGLAIKQGNTRGQQRTEKPQRSI